MAMGLKRILRSHTFAVVIGLLIVSLGLYSADTDRGRKRCEASMADRWDNALSWRQAHVARLNAWEADHPGATPADFQRAVYTGDVDAVAAVQYLSSARRLESRSAPTDAARAKRCQQLLPRWPWL